MNQTDANPTEANPTEAVSRKNLEYLADQLKFTGFGEDTAKQLAEKIGKQTPEFTLTHQARFGNDTVEAELYFKKSAQTERYFFNAYQVKVRKEAATDSPSQTFYINKTGSVTLKEAYNLLSGRAVNKELTNKDGQFYNAWLQIDFAQTDTSGNFKLKQHHQNYGFDLGKELSKHPLKELDGEMEKTHLLQSLRKGNRPSVTFVRDDGEHKHFIEANPRFKTVNVYDSDLRRVDTRQSNRESQTQGENTAQRTSQKTSQATGDDECPEIPPAKKRTRKQSPSVS